jgi:hypothetical protein
MVFSPARVLVVDESLFEYKGRGGPIQYIPSKPHQRGFLVYGLAGDVSVGGELMPVVLDFEPKTFGNEVLPQEAMMRLHSTLRSRVPNLHPHLVVDSAFGSFERLAELVEAGGGATMSALQVRKDWLWELLDWKCGINEGRAAFLPQQNIVIGSFKLQNENGGYHQLKIISSGCQVDVNPDAEAVVLKVSARRESSDGFEYLTHFADGQTEWLPMQHFMDDDGTTNIAWLNFIEKEDLEEELRNFTLNKLKVPSFLTAS